MMHCCMKDDYGRYLDCNDCKECIGFTCNECEFYNEERGCLLSKCEFKYSDQNVNNIEEFKYLEELKYY